MLVVDHFKSKHLVIDLEAVMDKHLLIVLDKLCCVSINEKVCCYTFNLKSTECKKQQQSYKFQKKFLHIINFSSL